MADKTSSSRSNPTLLLGLALALGVGLLLFVFTTSLQGKGKIYVAKGNVAAYSILTPDENMVLKDVPEDSITDNDLTEKDVESSKGTLVSRIELLDGQRVDRRSASASTTGTLGVVKKDKEVVVALEATFRGVVGGVVGPGSVVDVYNGEPSGDSAQALATKVKVLGVGSGASATANIRDNSDSKVDSKSNDATVLVIVAVPKDVAGNLSGVSTVDLALDPYLAFDREGNICDISKCSNRAASSDSTTSTEDPAATTPEEGSTTPAIDNGSDSSATDATGANGQGSGTIGSDSTPSIDTGRTAGSGN
jgi:hypothetical protein